MLPGSRIRSGSISHFTIRIRIRSNYTDPTGSGSTTLKTREKVERVNVLKCKNVAA